MVITMFLVSFDDVVEYRASVKNTREKARFRFNLRTFNNEYDLLRLGSSCLA